MGKFKTICSILVLPIVLPYEYFNLISKLIKEHMNRAISFVIPSFLKIAIFWLAWKSFSWYSATLVPTILMVIHLPSVMDIGATNPCIPLSISVLPTKGILPSSRFPISADLAIYTSSNSWRIVNSFHLLIFNGWLLLFFVLNGL